MRKAKLRGADKGGMSNSWLQFEMNAEVTEPAYTLDGAIVISEYLHSFLRVFKICAEGWI